MYKEVDFGPTRTRVEQLSDGSISYSNLEKLATYPHRLTEKLVHWAQETPQATFIAQKENNKWNRLSYAETLQKVKNLAQYLIDLDFAEGETVVILSENSVEHALLSLAAIHIGITYAPISPPYSLVSSDFSKLKHCLQLMTPKLIFVQDEEKYKAALQEAKHLFPHIQVLSANGTGSQSFEKAVHTPATVAVEKKHQQVSANTIAKVLFTSGSTGLPKGVMNHHGMWCANLQQITQVFPFLAKQKPVFIDWLPWNHTFGGNHNFGLTLYNGGSLYIDGGKPSKNLIQRTVENLREISPTAYFNVPKGFEMLIPFLESDAELRSSFFKNLEILFYAGASLAQPIWDKLEQLSIQETGNKIPIITGLGCTEAGPSAMFANWGGSFSGLLGVPVAGMDVRLVPIDDKLEARYQAPNITKGYWRNEEKTKEAFDEQGYYKSGDAVRFLDHTNPDKGLLFDGRIAEDFKLSTGTWVSTGILKQKVLQTGAPIIQDVVFTGLDKSFIGAILFLNEEACERAFNEKAQLNEFLDHWLSDFNLSASGSSTRIGKYIVAEKPPSIDLGEITDKGSLNQRMVLKHRPHLVDKMYNNEN